MVWALRASLMARKSLSKTTRNMAVDQHPVLGGIIEEAWRCPRPHGTLHDTFQAVDVRLPAPVPQYLKLLQCA